MIFIIQLRKLYQEEKIPHPTAMFWGQSSRFESAQNVLKDEIDIVRDEISGLAKKNQPGTKDSTSIKPNFGRYF